MIRICYAGKYITNIGEYDSEIPQFELEHILSSDAFRPIVPERKYLMDYNIPCGVTTDIQVPCRICLLASTMIILNDALKIKFCPQLSRAKLVVVLSEAFS